jgi:hypothetical protein
MTCRLHIDYRVLGGGNFSVLNQLSVTDLGRFAFRLSKRQLKARHAGLQCRDFHPFICKDTCFFRRTTFS